MNGPIVLIKVCYEESGTPNPPMALLSVGGALKKAGYDVRALHWNRLEAMGRLDEIVSLDPFWIGFSLITGDPSPTVVAMIRKLKQRLPRTRIVLGGVHPTLEPEQCLAVEGVDFVVLNEGERTAVRLSDALRDGRPVDDIPGLAYLRDGQPVLQPFEGFIEDLDQYSMDWSLVDIERYIAPRYGDSERVLMGYIASRGCPHACAFCYNLVFNQRRWRRPSADKTVRDINALVKAHRLGGVVLLDDNFTVNKEWALDVLKRLDIPSLHVETRIDYITDAFMKALSDCGVRALFLGVESGSDRILELIRKGFKADRIRTALKIADAHGIGTKLSFVMGVPTETLADHRASLELIVWAIENIKRVGFTLGFYLPYPGTPLFEMAVERGFKKPQRLEDWVVLDRWGTQNLPITWTAEPYLTPVEASRLRHWSGELIRLRDGRRWSDRLHYRALRWRFIHSGTTVVQRFEAMTARCRAGLGYLRWRVSPEGRRQLRVRLGDMKRRIRWRRIGGIGDEIHAKYLDLQYRRSLAKHMHMGTERRTALVDALFAHGRPSSAAAVLCIGCRNTLELDLIQERGVRNVIGIDLFSHDPRVQVMDMHKLRFADSSIDVIYASHSLEHARDIEQVAAEIRRVARLGALVIAEVPIDCTKEFDPTRSADLINFEGADQLFQILTKGAADLLWSERRERGAPDNPEGTPVVRLLCRLHANKPGGK